MAEADSSTEVTRDDGSASGIQAEKPAIKIVGRRKVGLSTPEDADRLLRTAWAIRGTDKLVPRGLYRFRSFEEAEEWMTRTMARTYVRLRSKTSAGSDAPSTRRGPATS